MKETDIDFDRYIIYEDGRIFSKAKNDYTSEKTDANGYVFNRYKLKDGSKMRFYRHRVIWTYFNGEIPEDLIIDHINTIRNDNNIENLRLTDYSGNNNNPITKQRMSLSRKGKKITEEHKRKIAEATKKPVAQIDKTTDEIIKIWDSTIEITRTLGYDNGCLSKCCNGKRTTAYGFKWSFV